MSYDILIIDPSTVPTDTYDNFSNWFREASKWEDERNYMSTEGSTPTIAACYNDMKTDFPSLNDDDLDDLDDEDDDLDEEFLDRPAADYSIGADFIYVAYAWSVAELAAERGRARAHEHNLAYVDISDSSTVFFADGTTLAE